MILFYHCGILLSWLECLLLLAQTRGVTPSVVTVV